MESVNAEVESRPGVRPAMIVPPKEDSEQFPLRLPPSLIRELTAIAKATGRTRNEAVEMMLRWAVERTKAELQAQGIKIDVAVGD